MGDANPDQRQSRRLGPPPSVLLAILVTLALVLFLGWPRWESHLQCQLQSQAIQIAADILRALEEYADDHNFTYCLSVDELIYDGYLSELPVNPYSSSPVRIIGEGDDIEAGDISYIPENLVYGGQHARGFILMVFGPENEVPAVGEGYSDFDLPEWIDTDRIEFLLRRGS